MNLEAEGGVVCADAKVVALRGGGGGVAEGGAGVAEGGGGAALPVGFFAAAASMTPFAVGNEIGNLQIASENQSAARSRIMDADFAQETATMTRAQIMQQAGTAMLAQANSAPQSVLQLLRG